MRKLLVAIAFLSVVVLCASAGYEAQVSTSVLWTEVGLSFQKDHVRSGLSYGFGETEDDYLAEGYVQYAGYDNRGLFTYCAGPSVSYFIQDSEGEPLLSVGALNVKADVSYRIFPWVKVFGASSFPLVMTGFQFEDGQLSDFSHLTIFGHEGLWNASAIFLTQLKVGLSVVI